MFGENRTYYYNCHSESVDYPWHKDNLDEAPGLPKPEQVTALWTFNGKWDPTKLSRKLNNKKFFIHIFTLLKRDLVLC